jgi:hypothetical protein
VHAFSLRAAFDRHYYSRRLLPPFAFSFYLLSLEDLREINPHKRKKERKKERRRSRTRRSRCTPRRHVVSFDRVFRVVSFWRGRSAPVFDLERHR